MKLKGYRRIRGVVEVVTGLHVGGSTSIIEIGGKDNPVIKHPISQEPYIPGSSIKGKMRSLLEWNMGKINTDRTSKEFGGVHKCKDLICPICVIFGTSAEDSETGPTRLIVRDAYLDPAYTVAQKKKYPNWTVIDLTEDKYENAINRITAKANPRNFERVVSGAFFSLNMSYRVFQDDDGSSSDDGFFEYVIEGLKLIECDALGGAGSRGCGQVKFYIDVDGGRETLDKLSVADFPIA